MSIKTLRKRIALVAVSAMGFGLLTTTAANAVDPGEITVSATSGIGNCGLVKNSLGATAATTDAADVTSLTLTAPLGSVIRFTGDTTDDWKLVGPADFLGGADFYGASGKFIDAQADVDVSFLGVGTVTLYNLGTTVANSLATLEALPITSTLKSASITVVAACTVETISASKSAIKVTDATNANDTLTAGSYGPDQLVFPVEDDAYIHMQAFNTYATAVPAGTWVASATNNAKVAIYTTKASATAATAAGSLSVVAKPSTDGTDVFVRVSRAEDTTAQSTTVTLSYNGTTMLTRTITFLGEATKINLVANLTGKVGSIGMFWYSLTDAAGNSVPGSIDVDPTTFGSRVSQLYNTAVLGKAATLAPAAIADVPGTGISALGPITYGASVFDCISTAGTGSADLTVRYYQPVTGSYITLPLTVKCAGGVNTYTISTDKASYKVGEIATVTITAKDSTGAAVSDFATVGEDDVVTAGGMTAIGAQKSTDTFLGGVKTYKFQVNALTSTTAFNAVATIAGTTTKSATASYTVTVDSGVSNAEVLAAIVKLIASISKQIKLLQKQLKKK